MSMTPVQSTTAEQFLYVSFELSEREWKLAFSTDLNCPPRLRVVAGRNCAAVLQEIAKAKQRFRLPPQTPVRSCYEAGRDGFWLHRFLVRNGIDNRIVDSASIEVNRRSRRAKSDRLDAAKLVSMLVRYHLGETRVWKVVRVPSVSEEDQRQVHRDLLEMKTERTQHVNRIKGLLASIGVDVLVNTEFAERLPQLRTWEGQPLPAQLQERLQREFARWEFVDRQIRQLDSARSRTAKTSPEPAMEKVRKLLGLRGVGLNGAWLYVMEFFSWRRIRNRRELAALAGLTPTPYASGDSAHEQGISKAGNRRLRAMAIELAWAWVLHQPRSRLTRWYRERFGGGNSRARRIGIVAVARKLLVGLWRYLEFDELPAGAETASWKDKLNARASCVPSVT
jgi:transposase